MLPMPCFTPIVMSKSVSRACMHAYTRYGKEVVGGEVVHLASCVHVPRDFCS